MAVIYKATNKVNGKSYIGFAVDFRKRKLQHKQKANCDDKQYFHNALAKYGYDSFEWSILLENAALNDEIRLIKEHDTFWETGKGYNLTRGGEGKLGYVVFEKTKSKLRIMRSKQKITEKQLKVLRENARQMKEHGHTEETKRKISESLQGRIVSVETRRKISENHAAKKETGKFYQSQEYKQKMSDACKGKKRTPEQREKYKRAALKRWGHEN